MLFLLFLGSGVALAEPRPNVVFILADDLGYGELGCYGQQRIPTPNLDRLAAEGVRLTRHYSGAPVCAPSRCVLLTGLHTGHAEIRGNRQAKLSFPEFDEGQHPLSDGAVTVAELFRAAGYATGSVGKWGLGPVGSTGDPNRQGFDYFFGYNCQAVAHSYFPRYLWRNQQRIEINPEPVPGHRKLPEGEVRAEDFQGREYAPHRMLEEAEGFIRRHKEGPFFLYLAFVEPHVAMHPPLELLDAFPREWDAEVYRGEAGYLPHPRPRAAYAAMIRDLDDHVGRIRAVLEEQGVLERTMIVFTSDNGTTHEGGKGGRFHIGGVDAEFFRSTRDLRGYKGSVYEGGLRVPAIVRHPGKIEAGGVSEVPGYFADWLPTLCEAAGVPAEVDTLDGQSLWPALRGGGGIERRPMVWFYPEYGGQVAVNFGRIKVVRRGLKTGQAGPWEVYDLEADRTETRELVDGREAWIARALEVLRAEVRENPVFPMAVPGI